MKFLKVFAGIKTVAAFLGIKTLYRTKIPKHKKRLVWATLLPVHKKPSFRAKHSDFAASKKAEYLIQNRIILKILLIFDVVSFSGLEFHHVNRSISSGVPESVLILNSTDPWLVPLAACAQEGGLCPYSLRMTMFI